MGTGVVVSGFNRSDRLRSLQAMRAMAALLVVWGHSIDGAEVFSSPTQADYFHWGHFGPCGVDIFFVISGFVVSQVAVRAVDRGHRERKHPSLHFLSRRITRIFPLYWLLTGAIIIHRKSSWKDIHWLSTVFLLPSIHYPATAPMLIVGWTLIFELYFYATLALFLVMSKRFLIRNTVLFFISAVFSGLAIGIRRPVLVVLLNPMILEFVFGCILGLLIVRYKELVVNIPRLGPGLAFLGAVALAATIFTGYGSANDAFQILAGYDCWLRVGAWGIPSVFLVGGMILWNPQMLSLPARLLVFLGDASYSIYLCTVPARFAVDHFWNQFSILGANTGVFLGAVFCTLVGIICYLGVERPMMKLFHNWYKPLPIKM